MELLISLLLVCQVDVYGIGNSKLNDAQTQHYPHAVKRHIRGGQSLTYIFNNPTDFELGPWTDHLPSREWDFVSVQPHPKSGSTLQTDVEAITTWMDMVPSATFVLYATWPNLTRQPERWIDESLTDGTKMTRLYFQRLTDAVLKARPNRTFLRADAGEVFFSVGTQTSLGFEPLYADSLHASKIDGTAYGRYIAHNTLLGAMTGERNLAFGNLDVRTREILDAHIDAALDWRTGDTNLNGSFDSSDLVHVFQAGEYEDGIDSNSGWSEGDWNRDDEFDSSDMVLAFQSGVFEERPGSRIVPIPEPASIMSAVLGSVLLASRSRKRINQGRKSLCLPFLQRRQ